MMFAAVHSLVQVSATVQFKIEKDHSSIRVTVIIAMALPMVQTRFNTATTFGKRKHLEDSCISLTHYSHQGRVVVLKAMAVRASISNTLLFVVKSLHFLFKLFPIYAAATGLKLFQAYPERGKQMVGMKPAIDSPGIHCAGRLPPDAANDTFGQQPADFWVRHPPVEQVQVCWVCVRFGLAVQRG